MFRTLVAVLLSLSLSLQGQNPKSVGEKSELTPEQQVYFAEHGTCEVIAGHHRDIAVGVDSLITDENQQGKVIGHHTGCKVRQVAPDTLFISVGLSAFASGVIHWDALGSAVEVFKGMPPDRPLRYMDEFAGIWSNNLWARSRQVGVTPPSALDTVAILSVLTQVGGEPVEYEIKIGWDGQRYFGKSYVLDSHLLDRAGSGAASYFKGLCREFVRARDYDTNETVPPIVKVSSEDRLDLDDIGRLKLQARTPAELSELVLRYEDVLTRIDREVQGANAGIGSPFATAWWDGLKHQWITNFNKECSSVQ